MSFDVPKAVEAVGNAIDSVSDCITTRKKRQSETEIIKEKRDLKRAVNAAEKMFKISARYLENFSDEDKKDYDELYNEFIKYN